MISTLAGIPRFGEYRKLCTGNTDGTISTVRIERVLDPSFAHGHGNGGRELTHILVYAGIFELRRRLWIEAVRVIFTRLTERCGGRNQQAGIE